MVTLSLLIKKYPQKTGKFVFLSRFSQNVSFSTCDFNISPLLWSERSGSKFKFFQIFKDFYVKTRPACSILGKKYISTLGFWEQAILRIFHLVAQLTRLAHNPFGCAAATLRRLHLLTQPF